MKKLVLILVFAAVNITTSFSQKKPFTIEDLYKIKAVGSPVLSPDGEKLLFNVIDYNLQEGKSDYNIYLINDDGSVEIAAGSESDETNPVWKNDDEFYFTAGKKLYLKSIKKKEADFVTEFYSGISDPKLSPDKNYLAFISDIYPECGADNNCNKSMSESADKGPIQAFIADNLLFRHWTDYRDLKETHLLLYDFKTRTYKDLIQSEWLSSMYKLGGDVKYNFSPDGKEICLISSDDPDLAASTNSDLYIISLDDLSVTNITKGNDAWDGTPVYSPDGKYIAYRVQKISGYEADRYRIALYDREKKSSIILTENFDYTIDDLKWGSDSRTIYFYADVQGYAPLYKIDINSGEISPVVEKRAITGFEISDKNEIYFVASSVDKPKEIYKQSADKKIEQLTFINQQVVNEVDIRPAEEKWFEGSDGKMIHCFIVKPHNFDSPKKYPLILNVHGGPQSQWMNSFRGDWQVYPGSGYIVAFPNPHGSTGYGSAFTEAISGDWGGKVFEDLMKVTDELEKLPYVDKERIGAMGWSFGGYMMNWFQAKTKRFKCLASMMGIFDLESMWGATEELWFVNWDLKGEPWKSDIYEKYSPSNYVENFATPTLIITGKKDYRVPYSQSVQYFTTLQTLGIDSRLIIFPNDGHWPSNVKSMPLYYNAHLDWFHKYLGGEAAPYDNEEMIKNLTFKEEKSELKNIEKN